MILKMPNCLCSSKPWKNCHYCIVCVVQLEEEWIQSNPEWVPELELMIRKK